MFLPKLDTLSKQMDAEFGGSVEPVRDARAQLQPRVAAIEASRMASPTPSEAGLAHPVPILPSVSVHMMNFFALFQQLALPRRPHSFRSQLSRTPSSQGRHQRMGSTDRPGSA